MWKSASQQGKHILMVNLQYFTQGSGHIFIFQFNVTPTLPITFLSRCAPYLQNYGICSERLTSLQQSWKVQVFAQMSPSCRSFGEFVRNNQIYQVAVVLFPLFIFTVVLQVCSMTAYVESCLCSSSKAYQFMNPQMGVTNYDLYGFLLLSFLLIQFLQHIIDLDQNFFV